MWISHAEFNELKKQYSRLLQRTHKIEEILETMITKAQFDATLNSYIAANAAYIIAVKTLTDKITATPATPEVDYTDEMTTLTNAQAVLTAATNALSPSTTPATPVALVTPTPETNTGNVSG